MIPLEHKYFTNYCNLVEISPTAEGISLDDTIRDYTKLIGGADYDFDGSMPEIKQSLTMEVIKTYLQEDALRAKRPKLMVLDDARFSENLKTYGDTDGDVFKSIMMSIRSAGFVEGARLATMAIPKLKDTPVDHDSSAEYIEQVEDLDLELDLPVCILKDDKEFSYAGAREYLNDKTEIMLDSIEDVLSGVEEEFSQIKSRVDVYPTGPIHTEDGINRLNKEKALEVTMNLGSPLSALKKSGCVTFTYDHMYIEHTEKGHEPEDYGVIIVPSINGLTLLPEMSTMDVVPDIAVGDKSALPVSAMDSTPINNEEFEMAKYESRLRALSDLLDDLYSKEVLNGAKGTARHTVMSALTMHYSSLLLSTISGISKIRLLIGDLDKKQKELSELNGHMNAIFINISNI